MKRYVVLALTILVVAFVVLLVEAKTGFFSKIFNKVGIGKALAPKQAA